MVVVRQRRRRSSPAGRAAGPPGSVPFAPDAPPGRAQSRRIRLGTAASRRGCGAGCWPRPCLAWPWCPTRSRARPGCPPRPPAGGLPGRSIRVDAQHGQVDGPAVRAWSVAPGLGTVPASGLAYVVRRRRPGRGRRRAHRDRVLVPDRALEWQDTLTGFRPGPPSCRCGLAGRGDRGRRPARGRKWASRRAAPRTEVAPLRYRGAQFGRYPAGGSAGRPRAARITVVVGATA